MVLKSLFLATEVMPMQSLYYGMPLFEDVHLISNELGATLWLA
jgi:hypothetical protein